ncbi:uncharacterized protein LOC106660136 [Trichogramma pretiosum]|uniref:Chemosensory protein n=1 Tax=Trichogramma kaykai TaxID=54128 RepID=A0ABD2X3U0_9HYME|nr:uncharacterized protein LOC106660136 [Trichogramma pretiosum]
MERKSVLSIILVVFICAVHTRADEDSREWILYPTTHDDFDINALLSSEQDRNSWYDCFMHKSDCPSDAAKFFKERLSEAVMTSCKFCTEKQLQIFQKFVLWYAQNDPTAYGVLLHQMMAEAEHKGIDTIM